VISLSQVKELELRVEKVVNALRVQTAENASLKERIAELETQLKELGSEISSRIADEAEIEAGLQYVFDMLNRVNTPDDIDGSDEAQSEDDSNSIADETDSSAESFSEDSASNSDAQTDDNNPFSAPDNSGANPMSEEGIHRPENAEFGGVNSGNVGNDSSQGEFDIF